MATWPEFAFPQGWVHGAVTTRDPWSEHPRSSGTCIPYSCYSRSFFSAFPFPVMGKSNFLDVSDRFGKQMMEENSSSISSGSLIIFALLPLSFLFFYLAQICHCSFFISLFPGFGFLPCFSWWAQRCLPWSSVHLCFPWRARIPDSFWHPDPSSFPFYLLTVFSHLFRYDFQAVWQLLLPATS